MRKKFFLATGDKSIDAIEALSQADQADKLYLDRVSLRFTGHGVGQVPNLPHTSARVFPVNTTANRSSFARYFFTNGRTRAVSNL